MKQSLNLNLSISNTFTSYRDNDNYGWLCGEFVRYFTRADTLPKKIKLTYTNKDPKEKGFRKVILNRLMGTLYYNIYVSGKYYNQVELFWSAECQLNKFSYKPVWIKIEQILDK